MQSGAKAELVEFARQKRISSRRLGGEMLEELLRLDVSSKSSLSQPPSIPSTPSIVSVRSGGKAELTRHARSYVGRPKAEKPSGLAEKCYHVLLRQGPASTLLAAHSSAISAVVRRSKAERTRTSGAERFLRGGFPGKVLGRRFLSEGSSVKVSR